MRKYIHLMEVNFQITNAAFEFLKTLFREYEILRLGG